MQESSITHILVLVTHSDNDIGDACEMDQDGDGTLDAVDSDGDKIIDSEDVAPFNKRIHRTDFSRHMSVPLTAGSRIVHPQWTILGNVSCKTISTQTNI